MADFDWKKLVAGIAPVLGTALGGPLIGEAVSMIGAALGLGGDASEAEVAGALASGRMTGEQAVALKQADLDFKVKMEGLRIDVLKLNAAADNALLVDTQDARHSFGANENVFVLGVWILTIFGVIVFAVLVGLFLLMTGKVTVEPGTLAVCAGLIGTIVGYAAANAQQVVSFFYGSSKGSKDNAVTLGNALTETIRSQSVAATTAAVVAATPDPKDDEIARLRADIARLRTG